MSNSAMCALPQAVVVNLSCSSDEVAQLSGSFTSDFHTFLKINNPDASVGVCCSHKVVAVGFNTLCYDASVEVLNPPRE